MFSREDRRERRSSPPRRRTDRLAVEGLETRQLMAYSALGYSLPQLSVTGYAAPSANWKSTLTIDVTVNNTGASSLVEPTNLAPGSISTADSAPTTVEVFAATKPNAHSGAIKIDTITIPSIAQNSNFETISTITLPARPAGFPGNGGKVYLTLVVNNNRAVLENSLAGNIYRVPTPVKIADALPNLQVVGFDIPSTLQPGDVIAPTIRIANLGTGNPNLQGPVLVQLVASTNTTFGPGDAVVGSYMIGSLPGLSGVPTEGSIANDANVVPTPNENTTTLAPIKLPTTPGTYYLGIVIDPYDTINMTHAPRSALQAPVLVGPADRFLPSANLLVNTTGVSPVFPASLGSVVNPLVVTTAPTIAPQFSNTAGPVVLSTLHAKAHKAAKKSKH